MTDRLTLVGEVLGLSDLLADPIVRATMASDGVSRRALEDLIETLRRARRSSGPDAQVKALRPRQVLVADLAQRAAPA
jgi:hypothetical protein